MQDEKLDSLQGDLVTCIDGEEGHGGMHISCIQDNIDLL